MLAKGSSGNDVTELQTALSMLGFSVAIDGKFGKATERAVREFQKREGLKVDGVVGPKTEAKLVEDLRAQQPTAPAATPASSFDADGWYSGARRFQMHERRIGPEITLRGSVVHTTDMRPGTMAGLVRRWTETQGERNGATFIIGRRAPTPEELATEKWPSCGVVQLAPVNRNTGHAGGQVDGRPSHGWIRLSDGKLVHPNSAYAGIELDGAGALRKQVTKYEHASSGTMFDAADVFVDERGRAWHVITDYQFEQLGLLLDAINAIARPFPDDARVQSNGSYQRNMVTWAALPGTREVGHVTLDPTRKTDPGPQVVEWMRARATNFRVNEGVVS